MVFTFLKDCKREGGGGKKEIRRKEKGKNLKREKEKEKTKYVSEAKVVHQV